MIHELGHTITAWLLGVPAVCFFFVSFYFAHSWFFHLLVLGVESWAIFWAINRRCPRLLGILICMALVPTLVATLLSSDAKEQMITMGGLLGELVISALVLATFPHRISFYKRWDQTRYVAAVIAGITLGNRATRWFLALGDHRLIPYPPDSAGGLMLFVNPMDIADSVPVGDLSKLLQVYGWPEGQLILVYAIIAIFSLIGVAAAGYCDSTGDLG